MAVVSSDTIATEMKPFMLFGDEFLTEEEKKSAMDIKEFSKKYRLFATEDEYLRELDNKVFYMETLGGLKRYYKYQAAGKISAKYIGEHAHFVAVFKVIRNESLADATMQVLLSEEKSEKTVFRKEVFSTLKMGNVVVMPISIYLRSKKYR